MLVADARLDLARARMRVGERSARVEAERQERDEALVRLEEAQLARLMAHLLANDPANVAGLDAAVLDCAHVLVLRQRLEVRLHGGDRGEGGANGELDLLGDLVRLLERQVAGKL